MLTEDQISQKALDFARETGTANIDFAMYYFQHGATWANEQNKNVLSGWKSDNARLEREKARLEAEIAELVEALRELHDEQNGAPLSRREENWFQAYRKAGEILSKYEK